MTPTVLLVLLPAALLHAYVAACLSRIAAETGTSGRWRAWLPGLNLFYPLRIARRSPWWSLALVAPAINVIAWTLLWVEICARLGRSPRWALAMPIPVLNLAALGGLARLEGRKLLVGLALALSSLPLGRAAWERHERARVEQECRALDHPQPERRRRAAESLARLGAAAAPALPSLIEALEDEDAGVRARAAEALGRLGPASRAAFPALAAALRDENGPVRRSAAWALPRVAGRNGDAAPLEAALPALLEAARPLGDGALPDPDLVDALAGFGLPALPRLVDALHDDSKGARWHAAGALLQLGPAGHDAVPALLEAMKDPEWEVRNAAGLTLESLAGADHVPAVVAALRDDSVETRYHAARTLARLGPQAQEALPVLVAALGDEDWEVRMHSARALGRIGREARSSVPSLLRSLKDTHAEVRASTAWSLGQIGEGAVGVSDALSLTLQDPDRDVRAAAAYALEKIHGR